MGYVESKGEFTGMQGLWALLHLYITIRLIRKSLLTDVGRDFFVWGF